MFSDRFISNTPNYKELYERALDIFLVFDEKDFTDLKEYVLKFFDINDLTTIIELFPRVSKICNFENKDGFVKWYHKAVFINKENPSF